MKLIFNIVFSECAKNELKFMGDEKLLMPSIVFCNPSMGVSLRSIGSEKLIYLSVSF